MTEKKQPTARQSGRGQEETTESMGLDHGAASLVAQDSPDDPQLGAPEAGTPKQTAYQFRQE